MPKHKLISIEELRFLTVELLKTRFNSYFSTKALRDEIIAKKFDLTLRQIICKGNRCDELLPLKSSISRQLSHVLYELQENGKIQKHSLRYWRKIGEW